MKKILLSILLLTSLNGCAVPLVSSVIGNGGTIIATGKIEQAIIKQGFDLALHSETGKTTTGYVFELIQPNKDNGLAVAPTYDPILREADHAAFLQGAKLYFE